MTDYEKLKTLLDYFGVGYKERTEEDGNTRSIKIKEGYSKVKGYSFFFAEWSFNIDGDFVDVGIWE